MPTNKQKRQALKARISLLLINYSRYSSWFVDQIKENRSGLKLLLGLDVNAPYPTDIPSSGPVLAKFLREQIAKLIQEYVNDIVQEDYQGVPYANLNNELQLQVMHQRFQKPIVQDMNILARVLQDDGRFQSTKDIFGVWENALSQGNALILGVLTSPNGKVNPEIIAQPRNPAQIKNRIDGMTKYNRLVQLAYYDKLYEEANTKTPFNLDAMVDTNEQTLNNKAREVYASVFDRGPDDHNTENMDVLNCFKVLIESKARKKPVAMVAMVDKQQMKDDGTPLTDGDGAPVVITKFNIYSYGERPANVPPLTAYAMLAILQRDEFKKDLAKLHLKVDVALDHKGKSFLRFRYNNPPSHVDVPINNLPDKIKDPLKVEIYKIVNRVMATQYIPLESLQPMLTIEERQEAERAVQDAQQKLSEMNTALEKENVLAGKIRGTSTNNTDEIIEEVQGMYGPTKRAEVEATIQKLKDTQHAYRPTDPSQQNLPASLINNLSNTLNSMERADQTLTGQAAGKNESAAIRQLGAEIAHLEAGYQALLKTPTAHQPAFFSELYSKLSEANKKIQARIEKGGQIPAEISGYQARVKNLIVDLNALRLQSFYQSSSALQNMLNPHLNGVDFDNIDHSLAVIPQLISNNIDPQMQELRQYRAQFVELFPDDNATPQLIDQSMLEFNQLRQQAESRLVEFQEFKVIEAFNHEYRKHTADLSTLMSDDPADNHTRVKLEALVKILMELKAKIEGCNPSQGWPIKFKNALLADIVHLIKDLNNRYLAGFAAIKNDPSRPVGDRIYYAGVFEKRLQDKTHPNSYPPEDVGAATSEGLSKLVDAVFKALQGQYAHDIQNNIDSQLVKAYAQDANKQYVVLDKSGNRTLIEGQVKARLNQMTESDLESMLVSLKPTSYERVVTSLIADSTSAAVETLQTLVGAEADTGAINEQAATILDQKISPPRLTKLRQQSRAAFGSMLKTNEFATYIPLGQRVDVLSHASFELGADQSGPIMVSASDIHRCEYNAGDNQVPVGKATVGNSTDLAPFFDSVRRTLYGESFVDSANKTNTAVTDYERQAKGQGPVTISDSDGLFTCQRLNQQHNHDEKLAQSIQDGIDTAYGAVIDLMGQASHLGLSRLHQVEGDSDAVSEAQVEDDDSIALVRVVSKRELDNLQHQYAEFKEFVDEEKEAYNSRHQGRMVHNKAQGTSTISETEKEQDEREEKTLKTLELSLENVLKNLEAQNKRLDSYNRQVNNLINLADQSPLTYLKQAVSPQELRALTDSMSYEDFSEFCHQCYLGYQEDAGQTELQKADFHLAEFMARCDSIAHKSPQIARSLHIYHLAKVLLEEFYNQQQVLGQPIDRAKDNDKINQLALMIKNLLPTHLQALTNLLASNRNLANQVQVNGQLVNIMENKGINWLFNALAVDPKSPNYTQEILDRLMGKMSVMQMKAQYPFLESFIQVLQNAVPANANVNVGASLLLAEAESNEASGLQVKPTVFTGVSEVEIKAKETAFLHLKEIIGLKNTQKNDQSIIRYLENNPGIDMIFAGISAAYTKLQAVNDAKARLNDKFDKNSKQTRYEDAKKEYYAAVAKLETAINDYYSNNRDAVELPNDVKNALRIVAGQAPAVAKPKAQSQTQAQAQALAQAQPEEPRPQEPRPSNDTVGGFRQNVTHALVKGLMEHEIAVNATQIDRQIIKVFEGKDLGTDKNTKDIYDALVALIDNTQNDQTITLLEAVQTAIAAKGDAYKNLASLVDATLQKKRLETPPAKPAKLSTSTEKVEQPPKKPAKPPEIQDAADVFAAIGRLIPIDVDQGPLDAIRDDFVDAKNESVVPAIHSILIQEIPASRKLTLIASALNDLQAANQNDNNFNNNKNGAIAFVETVAVQLQQQEQQSVQATQPSTSQPATATTTTTTTVTATTTPDTTPTSTPTPSLDGVSTDNDFDIGEVVIIGDNAPLYTETMLLDVLWPKTTVFGGREGFSTKDNSYTVLQAFIAQNSNAMRVISDADQQRNKIKDLKGMTGIRVDKNALNDAYAAYISALIDLKGMVMQKMLNDQNTKTPLWNAILARINKRIDDLTNESGKHKVVLGAVKAANQKWTAVNAQFVNAASLPQYVPVIVPASGGLTTPPIEPAAAATSSSTAATTAAQAKTTAQAVNTGKQPSKGYATLIDNTAVIVNAIIIKINENKEGNLNVPGIYREGGDEAYTGEVIDLANNSAPLVSYKIDNAHVNSMPTLAKVLKRLISNLCRKLEAENPGGVEAFRAAVTGFNSLSDEGSYTKVKELFDAVFMNQNDRTVFDQFLDMLAEAAIANYKTDQNLGTSYVFAVVALGNVFPKLTSRNQSDFHAFYQHMLRERIKAKLKPAPQEQSNTPSKSEYDQFLNKEKTSNDISYWVDKIGGIIPECESGIQALAEFALKHTSQYACFKMKGFLEFVTQWNEDNFIKLGAWLENIKEEMGGDLSDPQNPIGILMVKYKKVADSKNITNFDQKLKAQIASQKQEIEKAKGIDQALAASAKPQSKAPTAPSSSSSSSSASKSKAGAGTVAQRVMGMFSSSKASAPNVVQTTSQPAPSTTVTTGSRQKVKLEVSDNQRRNFLVRLFWPHAVGYNSENDGAFITLLVSIVKSDSQLDDIVRPEKDKNSTPEDIFAAIERKLDTIKIDGKPLDGEKKALIQNTINTRREALARKAAASSAAAESQQTSAPAPTATTTTTTNTATTTATTTSQTTTSQLELLDNQQQNGVATPSPQAVASISAQQPSAAPSSSAAANEPSVAAQTTTTTTSAATTVSQSPGQTVDLKHESVVEPSPQAVASISAQQPSAAPSLSKTAHEPSAPAPTATTTTTTSTTASTTTRGSNASVASSPQTSATSSPTLLSTVGRFLGFRANAVPPSSSATPTNESRKDDRLALLQTLQVIFAATSNKTGGSTPWMEEVARAGLSSSIASSDNSIMLLEKIKTEMAKNSPSALNIVKLLDQLFNKVGGDYKLQFEVKNNFQKAIDLKMGEYLQRVSQTGKEDKELTRINTDYAARNTLQAKAAPANAPASSGQPGASSASAKPVGGERKDRMNKFNVALSLANLADEKKKAINDGMQTLKSLAQGDGIEELKAECAGLIAEFKQVFPFLENPQGKGDEDIRNFYHHLIAVGEALKAKNPALAKAIIALKTFTYQGGAYVEPDVASSLSYSRIGSDGSTGPQTDVEQQLVKDTHARVEPKTVTTTLAKK